MYSKNLSGINTLSWSVESMGLRPELPWRARRYKIAPDESVQHWNLFLLRPPILLIHISSDQYWECSKSFQRSSFNPQNSIAPSSSRSGSPKSTQLLWYWAISSNFLSGSAARIGGFKETTLLPLSAHRAHARLPHAQYSLDKVCSEGVQCHKRFCTTKRWLQLIPTEFALTQSTLPYDQVQAKCLS